MAKFDESKIINALNKDKAEIGKRYWYADFIGILKEKVEKDNLVCVRELIAIDDDNHCCFDLANSMFELLYPYEEPSNQRMTKRQLSEWCAKGNGEYSYKDNGAINYTKYKYCIGKEENDEVDEDIVIRSWDSDEWIEPLYSIYERDCKGGK